MPTPQSVRYEVKFSDRLRHAWRVLTARSFVLATFNKTEFSTVTSCTMSELVTATNLFAEQAMANVEAEQAVNELKDLI